MTITCLLGFIIVAAAGCGSKPVTPSCPPGTYPSEFAGGGYDKLGGKGGYVPGAGAVNAEGAYQGAASTQWRCMPLCAPGSAVDYKKNADESESLRCMPGPSATTYQDNRATLPAPGPASAPAPVHPVWPSPLSVPVAVEPQSAAPAVTSTIIGIVRNAITKEPIPDAVVRCTGPAGEGEQIVVTAAGGNWRIPQLTEGDHYVIRVEAHGYLESSRGGIKLTRGTIVRVNMELQPDPKVDEVIIAPSN